MNKFKFVDYTEKYNAIMHFNKNKQEYIHRWYPFVEGYSKKFINSILEELEKTPKCCLDPFSGSGTTPLELQKRNIKCHSFEVNPFLHLLSKTKLRTDYNVKEFYKFYQEIKDMLKNIPDNINDSISIPEYKTIVEKKVLKKWIFNYETFQGLMDIKYTINKITNKKYQNIFKIILASILLEVSNVYRNGKCLSYKPSWQKRDRIDRINVHKRFLSKAKEIVFTDLAILQAYKSAHGKLFSNKQYCIFGDVRKELSHINDNSIDLVITSPPYLNSRDYTDIYMIELWMLDLVTDYKSLRKIRENTLRSHVQINWVDVHSINNKRLNKKLKQLLKFKDQFWNKHIPKMINGYFEDMDLIFSLLYKKMNVGGKIYFNVANSAYYGIEFEVDKICSEIAERNGFTVEEIRIARLIKPSGQQKEKIDSLRESVIVIKK